MYKVKILNNIAEAGLDVLHEAGFSVSKEEERPDGIMVRSANMHGMDMGRELLCIARAGAGTNNIPIPDCTENGIGCDVIPPVTRDGIRISSTWIRELIINGEMEKACEYLGHAHVLTDVVRVGRRLGRTIDAPTINMHFRDGIIVPRYGVYATEVCLDDGSVHIGVTNVGVRPTVDTSELVTAETHILDYGGNLYGKQVRVRFYKFIRPEQKFGSVDELKAQIRADAEATRAYFAGSHPEWPDTRKYSGRISG